MVARRTTHTGENVRAIREFLGVTQCGLARNVASYQRRISEIEHGMIPREGELEAIALALDVPVEMLRSRDLIVMTSTQNAQHA